MLSIARLFQVAYYLGGQSGEAYFAKGSELCGQWFGQGAKKLGLVGAITAQVFKLIFSGFGADGRALIQNAGEKKHRPGWDLTFSAPKAVSILFALASAELRDKILICHRKAVMAALSHAERVAAYARAGKGGWRFLPAELAIAVYEHYTSRAGDMDVHSHCLLANLVVCNDGVTRTLYSRQFYRWKLALGAYYRNELAYQLQSELGLAINPDGHAFTVAGIPDQLIRHFSKRRQAIEQELVHRGRTSAQAAEAAALDTRPRKQVTSLEENLKEWQAEAERFGFSRQQADRLTHRAPCPVLPADVLRKAIEEGVAKLGESQAHFGLRELLREVTPKLMARGIGSPSITAAVEAYLQRTPGIIHLQELNLERQYTTKEIIEREAALLSRCEVVRARDQFRVPEWHVKDCLVKHPGVAERPEQVAALQSLLADSALTLLSGMPGTGKTWVLKAARETWEKAGFRVVGAALAGNAARELESKSNIPSDTLAKWLKDLEATPLDDLKHDVKQLVRAAQSKKTFAPNRLWLDRSTVLVVDEAGMMDTATATRLIQQVEVSGAKLVLVGDPRQLPPIGAGGPFAALLSRYPTMELTDIRRQANSHDVAAIHALSRGDVRQALRSYEERGLVSIADDRRQAMEQLIADWASHGGVQEPGKHAILVCTNSDRLRINQLCQERRHACGHLHPERYVSLRTRQDVEGAGAMVIREDLHVGDRVMCLKRYRPLALENGQTGQVTWVDRETQTIGLRMDGTEPRDVVVPLKNYAHLTLSYAATVHKMQGATVQNSYVLLGGSLQSRETTYVQISRASGTTRLYADALEAGQDLSGLVRQIEQSHSKLLAHDLLPPARPEQEIIPPAPRSITARLKKAAEELTPPLPPPKLDPGQSVGRP